MGNLLVGSPFEPFINKTLPEGIVANKIYIIDFGQSRQFALGPGAQRAITLPETQIPPPNDLHYFDPYSWDVHCVGRAMQELLEVSERGGPYLASAVALLSLWRSIDILAGGSQGPLLGSPKDTSTGSLGANGAAPACATVVRRRVRR